MPHLRRTTKRNPPRHSDPVAAIPAKRRQDLLADSDRFLKRNYPIVPSLMALEIPYGAAMRASFRQIFYARRDELDFNLEWRTPYEKPLPLLDEQEPEPGPPRSAVFLLPNPLPAHLEGDVSFPTLVEFLLDMSYPEHKTERVIWLDEHGLVVPALPHVCPPSTLCDAVVFYAQGALHLALYTHLPGNFLAAAQYYPRKPQATHQPVQ